MFSLVPFSTTKILHLLMQYYFGGQSWIRTRELKGDQIYSLAVLATHPTTHINKIMVRPQGFEPWTHRL